MTRHHPAGNHPDPQIAKLPKWAQQHVSKLERRIEELQAQLDSFTGEVDTRGATPLTLDQVDEGIHIARSLLLLLRRERELLIDEQLPTTP